MFAYGIAGAVVAGAIAEHNQFIESLKLMSPEEAEAAKERRDRRIDADLAHYRALEVARASKPSSSGPLAFLVGLFLGENL